MMFADDTALYQSHVTIHAFYSEIQKSLDKMYDWCVENQITLNGKKCEYVQFYNRKNVNHNFSLELGDVTLNRVGQYKFFFFF